MLFSSAKTRLAGALGGGETERRGEPGFDAKQVDRHTRLRVWARIASQSLGPGKASVGTLGTGKESGSGRVSVISRLCLDFYALVAKQVDTRVPMKPAAPIVPEKRFASDAERMQQHADLARLCRCIPIPLALFAHRTRATTANARSIHDTQAAISFSTVLMWGKCLVCRAPKRSIGLERKVLACEATGFPGRTHCWWGIASGRSGVWWSGWKSRSKLGRAHRLRLELMAQRTARRFQTRLARPVASTPVPRPHDCTTGPAPALGLHLRGSVQRHHDAGTTQPHRRP